MIVMVHQFEYMLHGKEMTIESSMVNIGEDETFTSMSNLVGLPIAICAKMILTEKLTDIGVCVPIAPHVYNPILDELADYGVKFIEQERALSAANH
jgi:saccharopine dehydrogenase-like NADP-dependent oxidoreductase